MLDIDILYFKWLMRRIDGSDRSFYRLCLMLYQNEFNRRVGHDVNRAVDGEALRRVFLDDYLEADLDPRITNDFMALKCTWLEMLIALSEHLDYLYDGGVRERFTELAINLGLDKVLAAQVPRSGVTPYDEVDQEWVDICVSRVDNNQFEADGRGGLFPLDKTPLVDQREVEIWEQHAAYFRERLEGVMWISTS